MSETQIVFDITGDDAPGGGARRARGELGISGAAPGLPGG